MYQFLLIIFLLLQTGLMSMQDRPSWLDPANDQKSKVEQYSWWWPFRSNNLNHEQQGHALLQSQLDVDVEVQNDCSDVLKINQVTELRNKIKPYLEDDGQGTFTELKNQFDLYVKNVQKYKHNIGAMALDNFAIVLPQTTIEEIDSHIKIMIASKNVDYTWQFKKCGPILGSFWYMKNLFMPRSTYSYIGSSLASLGFLSVFFKKTPQPQVMINAHAGAHLMVHNNQNSQQDVVKTIAVCSLITGATIAARQAYLSWMYGANSKRELAHWIQSLQTHNSSIENKTVYRTMHVELRDVANTTKDTNRIAENTRTEVQGLRNDIDIATQIQVQNHQENRQKFNNLSTQGVQTQTALNELSEQVKNVQQGQTNLQNSVDQLNVLLSSLSIKFIVSQQQFCNWLGDEAKRRDEFDTKVMNKIDASAWIQVQTYFNSCKQLAITEQIALHQGIRLRDTSSSQDYHCVQQFSQTQNVLPRSRLTDSSQYIDSQAINRMKIFKKERTSLQHKQDIKDWKRFVLTTDRTEKPALTASAQNAYATVIQQKWRTRKLANKIQASAEQLKFKK